MITPFTKGELQTMVDALNAAAAWAYDHNHPKDEARFLELRDKIESAGISDDITSKDPL